MGVELDLRVAVQVPPPFGDRRREFGEAVEDGHGGSLQADEAADQAAHEGGARLELVERDELVGLVRLLDRAGPADDRGEPALLKLARLGLVGDDVPAVVAGQRPRQPFRRAVRFRREPRHFHAGGHGDAGVGVDRLRRRLEPRRLAEQAILPVRGSSRRA